MGKAIVSIICTGSHDRDKKLAKILIKNENIEKFYRWDNNEWYYYNKDSNNWEDMEPPDNKQVDLLFHHSTDKIVSHMPIDAIYNKCAKFTGASTGSPKVQEGECSISPPFPDDENIQCPLNDNDINELVDWAIGVRTDLPSICGIDLYIENSIRLLEKFLPLYITLELKKDFEYEINKLKEDMGIPSFIEKIKTDNRWEKASNTYNEINKLLSAPSSISYETFTEYYKQLRDELLPEPEEVKK